MLNDKLKHIKNVKSLFEQESVWIRHHHIKKVERRSKELYKMKDVYRHK